MSFNKKSVGTQTKNLAGGMAYQETPELELVSLLLVQDKFYESASDTFKRLKNLLPKIDVEFAAKAAIYARKEFGMRSITHVLAAELTSLFSGHPKATQFYNKIVDRLDDMTEIVAYMTQSTNGKFDKPHRMSEAMKRGFRKAFSRFDAYQIAKYKSDNKNVKLIDMINLLSPVPSERNGNVFEKLIKGELKPTKTSSAEMSAIGQRKDLTEEKKADLKKESWHTRIVERQIGYFDLLRNLRNIIEQAPESIDEACAMLTQEKLVEKCRIFPFQFLTAWDEIEKIHSQEARKCLIAISKAIDISAKNVPKFPGKTCVVLDCSGSMQSVLRIGCLFTAALIKANLCDLVFFGDRAGYVQYNPTQSITATANAIHCNLGGTDFGCIFRTLNQAYDRIIILSDMQGWLNDGRLKSSFAEYKKQYQADPQIWSFDLAGHGTLQFPERNIYCVAGFSDKIFGLMQKLTQDKNALINEINAIEL